MNPLIQAVITGNLEAVKTYQMRADWRQDTDSLGFTALELARFLGHAECAQLLGDQPAHIRVKLKGKTFPTLLSQQDFDTQFAVVYRRYPHFTSYESLKRIIKNCPYLLRSARLAADNYAWTNRYREELMQGQLAPIEIKWINPFLRYGIFAFVDIPQGAYVGEYTGLVAAMDRGETGDNDYCLHYPTRFWSWHYYVVDALEEGNEMRFVNHSDLPNLQPLCLVDRCLLRLVFVAKKDIVQGEQLTFNYGPDYWQRRQKMEM